MHDEGAKWGFGGCFLCFGLVVMIFAKSVPFFGVVGKKGGGVFHGGVGVMKVEFLLNFSIINEKISCIFPSVIGEFFLTLQSTKSWYRHFLALI